MKYTNIHKEISSLYPEIKNLCRTPQIMSSEDAEYFTENPEVFYRKKMELVKKIPEDLESKALDVSQKWLEHQNKLVKDIPAFKQHIVVIDCNIRSGKEWKDELRLTGLCSNGAVRNIDHVELFAWMLPAASVMHSDYYQRIGMVKAGLLFIDSIYKHLEKSRYYKDFYSQNLYDTILGLKSTIALFNISKQSI